MNHKTICVAIVLMGLAVVGCGPSTGYLVKPIPADERLTETTISTDGGLFVSDKIAIIDLEGMLMNQRDWSIFSGSENPLSLFLEKMDRAKADPSVKAVVLRINSPGGGVTAGEILYKSVADFRAARKAPVIAIIEDVGASGAYYVACASDTILAHPTSITGSIGVVVQTVSVAGTMRMLGIEGKAVTSGPMKEMGSPFKPLDGNDLAILQVMVNEFYGGFVDVVAHGRPKLTREQILKLADGRVYSGRQAKANGLVDDVGFVEDALALAKKRAGVAKAKVVMYGRPWGYRATFYSEAPQAPATSQINLVNLNAASMMTMLQPQFLYLWTGK
jgi:protease-4